MKTKKTKELVVKPAAETLQMAIAAALKSGKCRGGDGNGIATHSQSGLCENCLSNLALKRRMETNEPAKRVKYRNRLKLAAWREDELIRAPKGYTKGAAR